MPKGETRREKMKKLMIAAAVLVAMSMGVYADEAKADAKAEVKAEAKVCEACAKLAKDAKEGEKAKLCPACQKKADEAAAAAKKDAAK